MDFFKILNIAGTILAWLIVIAVIYAMAAGIVKDGAGGMGRAGSFVSDARGIFWSTSHVVRTEGQIAASARPRR